MIGQKIRLTAKALHAIWLGSEHDRRAMARPASACRGDAFESYLKRWRDEQHRLWRTDLDTHRWDLLNDLLDDYRLHADTGTPLDRRVPAPDGIDQDDRF